MPPFPGSLRPTASTGLAISGVLLAIGIGALVAFHHRIERPLLLLLVLLLTLAPLAVRASQRRLDIFEPLTLLCVAGFAMFFVRPIAQLATGESFYRGWDIRGGFDQALLIAAVGLSVVLAAYASGASRDTPTRGSREPRRWDDKLCRTLGIWLALAAAALYAVFLIQSGDASEILSGRSLETTQTFANSNGALLLAPVLAIPATLLLVQSGLETGRTRSWIAAATVGVIFVGLMIPRGERLALLGFTIAVAALPYLHRGTRPRFYGVISVLILAFLLSGFLKGYRDTQVQRPGAEEYLQTTVRHPTNYLDDLFLGPDTDMFPNLALEASVVPSRIDFTPGRALTSAVGSLLPASALPNKPRPPDAAFNDYFYSDQVRLTGAGSALSYFGGLWYDSGFIGVTLGSLAAGYLFGRLWRYLRSNQGDPYSDLIYAASLPFVVILLRGNPADSIPRAIYAVGPLIALAWYARTSQRSEQATARVERAETRALRRASSI